MRYLLAIVPFALVAGIDISPVVALLLIIVIQHVIANYIGF